MHKKQGNVLVAAILVVAFMSTLSSVIPAASQPSGKVNINTAGVEQLKTLPRIGEKVAQRIIDFRGKNGKFKRVEGLMKVKGIGEKMFKKLKDRITV